MTNPFALEGPEQQEAPQLRAEGLLGLLLVHADLSLDLCAMLQGIKAALLRCFGTLSPTVLAQGCPQQPQTRPRLLFVLAFFHALVLERRKYGSLGWNTMYDFSDGDWLCARHTLSMFLNTQVGLAACLHHPPL